MTIEFRCNSCDKLLRVKDESAGKKAKCPGCSSVVQIPAQQAAEPKPEDDPFDFSSAAPPAAENPFVVNSPATNPYAAPEIRGQAYAPSNSPRSGAVTAVAIVNYIVGGLQLACGMFFIFGGAMVASIIGAGAAQDPNLNGPIVVGAVGGVVLVIGLFITLLGVPMLLAGYGVQQRYQWGRILTLVLGGLSALGALLNLISLNPACIINGSYSVLVFVVLLNKKYAAEF